MKAAKRNVDSLPLFYFSEKWCATWDSNPHAKATGPKPVASANSASRAFFLSCSLLGTYLLPELPKPPSPLSEPVRVSQSSKVTSGSLQITIWAILSPRSIL